MLKETSDLWKKSDDVFNRCDRGEHNSEGLMD